MTIHESILPYQVTITQNEERFLDNFCNKCAISVYTYHLPYMYHEHSLNNKGGNLYRLYKKTMKTWFESY